MNDDTEQTKARRQTWAAVLLVALATTALVIAEAAGATGASDTGAVHAEARLHAEVHLATDGADSSDGAGGSDGGEEPAGNSSGAGRPATSDPEPSGAPGHESPHMGDGADHAAGADATAQAGSRAGTRGNVQGGAATQAEATLSACPTEVAAQALGDGTVLVDFHAGADADAYQVLRAEADGPAEAVATLNATASTFLDTDVEAGITYTYQVQAVGGLSACPQVEVTTIPVFPSLAAGGLAVVASGLGYALLGRR